MTGKIPDSPRDWRGLSHNLPASCNLQVTGSRLACCARIATHPGRLGSRLLSIYHHGARDSILKLACNDTYNRATTIMLPLALPLAALRTTKIQRMLDSSRDPLIPTGRAFNFQLYYGAGRQLCQLPYSAWNLWLHESDSPGKTRALPTLHKSQAAIAAPCGKSGRKTLDPNS